MSGDLASFAAGLPARYRHCVMKGLRQVCAAGVRWGHMTKKSAALAGPNPPPPPRTIRVYTRDELDALEVELGPTLGPIVAFAGATGLRPSEWVRVERRDLDRGRRVLEVRGTKTAASRRQVPLSTRALAAAERMPPRLDSPLLFPGVRGPLNLNNFRRRDWGPAVDAANIAKPARVYDLRSTFASNALASGVAPFELARIMGTSIAMIERSYGALITGASDSIADRLDALDRGLGHEWATEGGGG